MQILLTRPKASSEATAIKLKHMGHQTTIEPMINIVSVAAQTYNPYYSAIVFTSQNAVRVFNETNPNWLSSFTGKVFSVGSKTTQAIISAGCSNIIQGSGDVDGLAVVMIDNLKGVDKEILFPHGLHVEGDLEGLLVKAGIAVKSVVLYEAKATQQMRKTTINHLKGAEFNYVLFYSARTATTFINMAKASGMDSLPTTIAVALSAHIGEILNNVAWAEVRVAEEKTEQALFDCINNDMI